MTEAPPLGHEVLEAIAALPRGTRAAAFVRHSIRGEIATPTDDPPLTAEGLLAARQFGRGLDWPFPLRTVSSPRLRCLQTAREILGGFAEVHADLKASAAGTQASVAARMNVLGETPPLRELHRSIKRFTPGIAGPASVLSGPQVAYADRLARHVMTDILRDLRGDGRSELRLFVDHDLYLILLREHLFERQYRTLESIDPLGGFVVHVQDDSIMATLHGRTIPYHLSEGQVGVP